MVIRPDILDGWPEVQAHLPADFDLDRTARARGAFSRARQIKDAATLLRLALAYGGCGMSLRETCAWAEVAGLARLSDPSLIERLCGFALARRYRGGPALRAGADAGRALVRLSTAGA
jgi:hypothetical protein